MKIIGFIVGLIFAQIGFNSILMYQAQNIPVNLLDITKYTLICTPIIIILNIMVYMFTNWGNKIFNNLAFVSIAYTMLGVVVALILSAVVFKQPISIRAVIGCVFIFIGVILTGIK